MNVLVDKDLFVLCTTTMSPPAPVKDFVAFPPVTRNNMVSKLQLIK